MAQKRLVPFLDAISNIYETRHSISNISDLKKAPIAKPLSFRRAYTASDIAQLILYLFIFVSGTFGNIVVIHSFIRVSEKPGSRFVVALAAIDLITSVLSPSLNISIILYDYFPWGKIGCKAMFPLTLSATVSSAWMLVAISLERARLVFVFGLD